MKNKKAQFNYFLSEFETAGIMLIGNEVKSLHEGNYSFSDAYCYFQNGELFLRNFYIKRNKYEFTLLEELRERKLLLTKNQIKKYLKSVKLEGTTIIPTEITKVGNKFKLIIALGKGKKLYDKRNVIKERDLKREI